MARFTLDDYVRALRAGEIETRDGDTDENGVSSEYMRTLKPTDDPRLLATDARARGVIPSATDLAHAVALIKGALGKA